MTSIHAALGRKRAHEADADAGFSLVEMIVAIVLFLIVSVALLSALSSGLRATVVSEQRTRANETATKVIEGLRSVPWQNVGYYKSEYDTYMAQAGHSSPPYSESAVFIASTPPATRPSDVPALGATTVTVDAIRYTVTTWITWSGAANDGTTYAAKRISSDVTWTAGGSSHTLHAEGLRAPVASEMTPSTANPASQILTATVTPDLDTTTVGVTEQDVDAAQKTKNVLTFTATTDIAASSLTVSYTTVGGSTPVVLPLTGSNGGKTWTATLPVGTGPFDTAAAVPFSFTSKTATNEADTTTASVTFRLPAATPAFTISSPVTPAGQQLTTQNKTPSALTFGLTTNRAAQGVVVTYSTTSGPATNVVLTGGGTSWTGSLLAGAGPFSSTSPVTFTYVATSPEGLVQQTAVTVAFTSAPVAAPVVGTPTGTVAVNKNSGVACAGSNNTTITFSVANGTSSSSVTLTSPASASPVTASYTGVQDANAQPVFSYKWAAGAALSKTAFTVTITATAGSLSSGQQSFSIPVAQINNGQC